MICFQHPHQPCSYRCYNRGSLRHIFNSRCEYINYFWKWAFFSNCNFNSCLVHSEYVERYLSSHIAKNRTFKCSSSYLHICYEIKFLRKRNEMAHWRSDDTTSVAPPPQSRNPLIVSDDFVLFCIKKYILTI